MKMDRLASLAKLQEALNDFGESWCNDPDKWTKQEKEFHAIMAKVAGSVPTPTIAIILAASLEHIIEQAMAELI